MKLSRLLTILVMVFSIGAMFAQRPMAASAASILKNGDVVVIYGDSITEQRMYSRYIEEYFYCRYPNLKVSFYNAGWSGDTAGGALNRLDRDVLYLKPTVVTLFFGMNDGHYTTTSDAITADYRKNMEGIITALQAKGIKVIVFTPGCCDPDQNSGLAAAHYNDNLAALGKADQDLATKYNCPFVDVHDAMLSYQTAEKAKNTSFFMIPGGVHPDASGHLVMAGAMLKAFGIDPMPPLGEADLTTGKVSGVTVDGNTNGAVTLGVPAGGITPFWFESNSMTAMKDSGFQTVAEQSLIVKGLPKGTYTVAVDGLNVGTASNLTLATGIRIPGTYSENAHKIHDIANQKEDLYFTQWRQVRLPFGDLPGVQDALRGLSTANDALTTSAYTASASEPKHSITIALNPNGSNVAIGKSYICSDPNMYSWGIGGLTDGSWVTNTPNCFASGDKDAFPKTATIDLEAPASVSSIKIGVPPFGATKTVEALVSADGKTYKSVGTHVFSNGIEEKYVYTFPTTSARYVRLNYPDHYDDGKGYSATFVFTTECEVYAPDSTPSK